jgi:hypothetical protein
MGLRPGVDLDKFVTEVKAGYGRALNTLQGSSQVAIGPARFSELYDEVFGNVLRPDWKFRTHEHSILGPEGVKIFAAKDIEQQLQINAGKIHLLLDKDALHALHGGEARFLTGPQLNALRLNMISDFNVGFMEIQTFKDNLKWPFVNRTMAALATESHLEHCYRPHLLNRELDNRHYESALKSAQREGNQDEMKAIMMSLAHNGYNLYRMDEFRGKNQGHDHER